MEGFNIYLERLCIVCVLLLGFMYSGSRKESKILGFVNVYKFRVKDIFLKVLGICIFNF